jgi:hypothetical protein
MRFAVVDGASCTHTKEGLVSVCPGRTSKQTCMRACLDVNVKTRCTCTRVKCSGLTSTPSNGSELTITNAVLNICCCARAQEGQGWGIRCLLALCSCKARDTCSSTDPSECVRTLWDMQRALWDRQAVVVHTMYVICHNVYVHLMSNDKTCVNEIPND